MLIVKPKKIKRSNLNADSETKENKKIEFKDGGYIIKMTTCKHLSCLRNFTTQNCFFLGKRTKTGLCGGSLL